MGCVKIGAEIIFSAKDITAIVDANLLDAENMKRALNLSGNKAPLAAIITNTGRIYLVAMRASTLLSRMPKSWIE